MTWTSVFSSTDSIFLFFMTSKIIIDASQQTYIFSWSNISLCFLERKRLDFFIFIFSQATRSSFYLRRANKQILLSVLVKVAIFSPLFCFTWTKAFFCIIYFLSCNLFLFCFSLQSNSWTKFSEYFWVWEFQNGSLSSSKKKTK